MSLLTDQLYASWLAANGATRSPRPPRGYGGLPPWKRSETAPALRLSHAPADPAGSAIDAENRPKNTPKRPGAP